MRLRYLLRLRQPVDVLVKSTLYVELAAVRHYDRRTPKPRGSGRFKGLDRIEVDEPLGATEDLTSVVHRSLLVMCQSQRYPPENI